MTDDAKLIERLLQWAACDVGRPESGLLANAAAALRESAEREQVLRELLWEMRDEYQHACSDLQRDPSWSISYQKACAALAKGPTA